ncbi:tape measure protein [uncultured Mitsuokella sp.]|uniref:tape measure protein n=1 Tax=uncultured Mitsuokella sp. TaxID=453120 RepID=UPI00266FAD00|nr:tape measure protein [uncultured Mitsuokella sp.]
MATHDIKVKITADASGVNKAVSSTKSQLSGLKGMKVGGEPLAGLKEAAQASANSIQGTSAAVRGLESALGTLKGVVAGAFAVGSITAFGKAALEASANAEVLRKGLTFQLGADQADLLISKMKEIGETSAYDGSALIPMARLWVNVGDNAETAISKMNKIVDAGSAYGLTQEQIQNCTLALTQMAGAGKIDAGNMNQLTNDGIPAWQLLSDAMGVPVEQLRDMASKGDLTADSLNALWDGLVAKTQGASAEMQGTLMSHFTNLEESAQNSLAGIGDIINRAFDVSGILETAGEYVDQFKEHIASINEAITAGGDPATAIINEISAVSPAIGAVVNTAVAGFNAIKAVISENINLIKNIAIGVTAAVAAYMGIMKAVAVFTAVKNAITVATVAMRLFGLAMTAVNAVSALNPIVLVIAAIVAAIALLVANWDTVKAAAVSAMEAISSAVSGVVEWISSGFQSAVSAVSSIFSSIAETVGSVISSIGEGVSTAAETIGTVFTSIWESITASVTAAITTIEGIIGAIAAWIGTNVVTPIVDLWISGINVIVGLASVLAAGIQAAWSAIVSWVTANVTQPLAEAFQSAWTAITAEAAAVYSGIVGVFSAISSWFSTNIGQPIAEAFQSAWNAVTESATNAVAAISYAWDSVTEFFAEIWQSVVSAAQEAWQQVTEVATAAWAAVSQVWDAAVAFFAALWESILSAAQSAWDTVTSVASSTWTAIQGAWAAASSWFQSSVWTPICTAVSSVESAITGAFRAAYNAVTGLFSGLASWFESNVIAPIKEKFNALASIGSRITGLSTSGGSASVAAEAKGGINGGPMRLAAGGLVGGRIPALANGGQLKHGTPAVVGEAGPEAVIPLKDTVLAKIGEGIMSAYSKGKGEKNKAEDILFKIQSAVRTSNVSAYTKILTEAADKAREIGEQLRSFYDYQKKANEESAKYAADGQETLNLQDKIAQSQAKIAELQEKINSGKGDASDQARLKHYQNDLAEAQADYDKKKAAAIKAAQEANDAQTAIEKQAADACVQIRTQAQDKVYSREAALEEAQRQLKKASLATTLSDYTAMMSEKDAITGQSYATELANEEALNTQRQAWHEQMMLNATDWSTYMQTILTDLATNMQTGLAEGLADCIVKGKDLAATLGNMANSLLSTLIKGVMEKWISQWGILNALSSSNAKAQVANANAAAAAERVKSGVLAANATAAFIAANPWMAWGASGIVAAQMTAAKGAAMAFASGGPVRGAGTSTSDSIPTMLSNGEYVINADAAAQIGLPTLNAINSGNLPKYADGGEVGGAGGVAGAGAASPSVTLNVSAMDASSFTDFLRNGGLDTIRQALFDNNRNFGTEAGVW